MPGIGSQIIVQGGVTGEAPGGPAGGDLSGSYPNPEVEQSSTGAFTVKGTLITESAIQIRALAAKTANYIVMSADAALSFINSPTVTFGAALSNGQVVLIENIGAGVVTLAAANAGSIVGVTSVPANSGVLCYVASAGTNPVVWVVSPPAASSGGALGWANYALDGLSSGNPQWKNIDGLTPGFDYSDATGPPFVNIHFPADSITMCVVTMTGIWDTGAANETIRIQLNASGGTNLTGTTSNPDYVIAPESAAGGLEWSTTLQYVWDSVALVGQTMNVETDFSSVPNFGNGNLSLLSVAHP